MKIKNFKKSNIILILSLIVGILLIAGLARINNEKITKGSVLKLDNQKVHLSGKKLEVGQTLKMDFQLDAPSSTIKSTKNVNLNEFKGIKLIEVVPSLDMPVCSMQTAELNSYAKEFPEVTFIAISQDLPFALSRYCNSNGIKNVHILSDYKNKSFSKENSLLIYENQLNARAIIVVDNRNKIKYIEYADEITEPLDLKKAIEVVSELDK